MTTPKFDELEKARESLRQYEKNGLSKSGIINLDEGFGLLCEILTEADYTKEAKNVARNIAEQYINRVVIDVDKCYETKINIIDCITALNCCDEINSLIGISDSYKSLKEKLNSHGNDSTKNRSEGTISIKELAKKVITLSVEDRDRAIELLDGLGIVSKIKLNKAINKISAQQFSDHKTVNNDTFNNNGKSCATRNMKPRGCTVNGVHYENANDAVDALCRDGVIKKRDIPSSSFNAHLWLSTKLSSFGYTYKRDNY